MVKVASKLGEVRGRGGGGGVGEGRGRLLLLLLLLGVCVACVRLHGQLAAHAPTHPLNPPARPPEPRRRARLRCATCGATR